MFAPTPHPPPFLPGPWLARSSKHGHSSQKVACWLLGSETYCIPHPLSPGKPCAQCYRPSPDQRGLRFPSGSFTQGHKLSSNPAYLCSCRPPSMWTPPNSWVCLLPPSCGIASSSLKVANRSLTSGLQAPLPSPWPWPWQL